MIISVKIYANEGYFGFSLVFLKVFLGFYPKKF